MAAFTQRTISITQDRIVPKVFDQFLSENLATFRFVSNGKKWIGETLKFPVKIAKNTQGGSFSGMDNHGVDAVETRQTMSYDLRAYEIPVAVPGLDRLVNGTEAQVVNLVKTEMESSAQDGLDDVGDMFYSDGTGNASKDFNGLGNLADDGTTATNVGNLSRTTYSSLNGAVNASGGTMTLTKLATLYTDVAAGSATSQKPSLAISDETVWNLFESLLSPTVQANYQTNGMPVVTRSSKGAIPAGELKGAAGFTSLIYKGIPWVADEKATAQTVFYINENYLMWYGINDPEMTSPDFGSNIDGNYTDVPSKYSGLNWSGMMKPINSYGDVGHIYLFGNLVTNQPRRQGKLTGVTGI